MPTHHIEGRMVHLNLKQVAHKLGNHSLITFDVLISSDGELEVFGVRQTVRTNWAEVRNLEVAIVHLQDVASRITIRQPNGKDHVTLDHSNLSGFHFQEAKLSLDI